MFSPFLFRMHLVRVIQKARSALKLKSPSFFQLFFRLALSLKREIGFGILMQNRLASTMPKIALDSAR